MPIQTLIGAVASLSISTLCLIATSTTCILWLCKNPGRNSIKLYHVGDEDNGCLEESQVRCTSLRGFSLATLVKQKVPALVDQRAAFKPVWWLPSGNAQTIYCSLGDFTKGDQIIYQRKLIQVGDGGLLALDVTPSLKTHPVRDNEVVVVVAHGLTGGSHESYVRAALSTLTRPINESGLGLRAVVINSRGCNNSPVITPKLYHAGCSDDIRPVILWVCKTFPGCTILGLGFSLGANFMTKYIGEESEKCPMTAMVGLANVWDFVYGSYHIERGTIMNRLVYQNVLGGALRSLLQLHQHIFFSSPESPLPKALLQKLFGMRTVSLRQYDEMITAPLYGFKDASDYYYKISSSRVVDKIRIPVLGINSLDDPIVGKGNLPFSLVEKTPWVVLATTEHGGHMGWFESKDDGTLGRWYVKPTQEFFHAIIQSDLPPRPKPNILKAGQFWFDEANPNVRFCERMEEEFGPVGVGVTISKLRGGW